MAAPLIHGQATVRRIAMQLAVLSACAFTVQSPLLGQTRPAREKSPASSLGDLSAAIEDLSRHVSSSIVQVLVTGYGPVEDTRAADAGPVLARQRTMGAGAIVDSDGYILTAAHLVAGAERIQVVLNTKKGDETAVRSTPVAGRPWNARLVGAASDFDLALLKIDGADLPALRLADYDKVRQGQLVFAFGTPAGFATSMTMGVVSARLRQPDPDAPGIYLQTDAPINPGNSGGPLVDLEGRIVGIVTSIVSASGGSQGIGFAIPSAVIAVGYRQLRQFGRMQRGVIGVEVQTITTAMAEQLGMARESGIVVSDVEPDSPADLAGVQIQDVVATIDGKPIDSVPTFALELDRHDVGDQVTLGLLRGTNPISLEVHVIESGRVIDLLTDLADPADHAVKELGIVGVDVTPSTANLVPRLRTPSGVLVTARQQTFRLGDLPLLAGDVIHAVNGITIRSLDGLQAVLTGVNRDRPIVVQVERRGHFMFRTVQFY